MSYIGIKKIRLHRKMKQADLAKAVGVKQSSVSKWENGGANPDSEKLYLVSLALKCDSLSDLRGEQTA